MKITKSFEVAQPPARVWDAITDIRLVADCLPSAAITGDLGDDRYQGKFSVKLGPLAASFAGEIAIERRPEQYVAVVSGKGTDTRSSSRASGRMTYSVQTLDDDQRTRVDVVSEIDLAGPLAQFSKGAVMQEIANRITKQFAENFERRLREEDDSAVPISPQDTGPAASQESSKHRNEDGHAQALDIGGTIGSVLANRVKAFVRWISGRGGSAGR